MLNHQCEARINHTSLKPSCCLLPLSSNSYLIPGVQHRSPLSCTEQKSITSSSYKRKKKQLSKKEILFITIPQSLIFCCLKSAFCKDFLSFQLGKGVTLMLVQVEKVQLWCSGAWPSSHPLLLSRSCGLKGRRWHMLQFAWSFHRQGENEWVKGANDIPLPTLSIFLRAGTVQSLQTSQPELVPCLIKDRRNNICRCFI